MSLRTKTEDLEKLEAELQGSEPKRARPDTIRRYLKAVRDLKVRKSHIVALYGAELLRNAGTRSSLPSEELWLCYEAVAIAACDAKALPLAYSCAQALEKNFPDSCRAGRVKGMLLEADGKFQEAEKLYKELLGKDEANQMVLKRRVGLARSRGNMTQAIELLNEYLSYYCADTDAWDELSKMYGDIGMYKQAAFCLEECILGDPSNYAYQLALADVLYTLGGAENVRVAAKYYSASVEYSGGKNLKALYGLCACYGALASMRGPKPTEDEAELPRMAAQKLVSLYKESQPGKLGEVRALQQGWGLDDDDLL
mmetsp:Transcript_35701/g.112667  ORF Transcript_35701/g.112667 Transcript_35701/m.112667 type:complete len:312 (-) Transcript_35701:64-999(-)|eukprot:CAMPEP_0182863726 /NCGR_PEP_ID=MMETSP0034_2-20130328/6805_1 /TAXON_ID=156128 /ORGANISM="Nephroselmis pyriformis, Strain CCMP717" /LENGTH=311 /DNA_ID=CAMNT_0024995965 /DNA_START=185 /DNA_END=1120 /DNA_ORIENTATION=-